MARMSWPRRNKRSAVRSGRGHLVTVSPRDERLSQSEQRVAPLRDLVTVDARNCLFCLQDQWVAPFGHLVTQLPVAAPCASNRDYATARHGRGRRARRRGSSRGCPAGRASGLGSQPCWRVCSEAPSSSAGDGGYSGRGGIIFGSTCTCGGVPGPCIPSCEGRSIGQLDGTGGDRRRSD